MAYRMAALTTATTSTEDPPRLPNHSGLEYELFVVHADADEAFAQGYLVPALGLASDQLLLSSRLNPGASLVAEIERGITRSRITVVVLTPAYLHDRWAVLGEQLAGHAAGAEARLVPLLLSHCDLPLRLDFRVAL